MTPEKFLSKYKDGDVLVMDEQWIIIFAGLREPMGILNSTTKAIVYHALMDMRDNGYIALKKRTGIGYTKDYGDGEVRLATNRETDKFFRALESLHAKWDADAKELVVTRPIPRQ